MVQVLCFLLPPTIALLFGVRKEREKKPTAIWITEWVVCAVVLYIGTALLFLPFGRVTPRVGGMQHIGLYLYVEYGYMAMPVLYIFGVLLGLAGPRIRRILHVSWQKAEVLKTKAHMKTTWIVVHLLILVAFLLTYAYIWGLNNFGHIGMEQIVFHMNVPLKGTSGSLIESYLYNGLLVALIAFLVFEVLVFLPIKKRPILTMGKGKRLCICVLPLRMSCVSAILGVAFWLVFLVFSAERTFGMVNYVASNLKQSELIEREYVNPESVQIVFPQEKRNLITIYIESAETTNQDRENGGIFDVNYTPEMTRLAQESVSFSHSSLLEGATVAPLCGWTVAGLVAESAGLPLKLYERDDVGGGIDNSLGKYQGFMPGATMLGDILKEAGYRLAFMCGSDFSFGSRREMYAEHGGYEVYDYLYAIDSGMIEPDYKNGWGFEDEKLYAWAKDVLVEFAQGEQPFHFALLTVDTHSPSGYLCPLCPDTYENQYANVLACSSAQLDTFIRWCEQQPFYENTTIVVTGDHASMAPEFYSSEFDKYDGSTNRKVYNAFINSAVEPVQEENRMFTTMDFFPTTLASIGVQIEGDRLALGTNLFSDRETLSEQYGYEELFKQLSYKSLFYNNEILYP